MSSGSLALVSDGSYATEGRERRLSAYAAA